jgi:hypothetical protein
VRGKQIGCIMKQVVDEGGKGTRGCSEVGVHERNI